VSVATDIVQHLLRSGESLLCLAQTIQSAWRKGTLDSRNELTVTAILQIATRIEL
jgi:hypothetical protein